ncbi:LysR family transcriptional regulator [Aestuariispira ectoiniformans]|uniref:LysR family transcriptional regulator n=1 Tax=Aestuariispira ectoiniformans TaxID=2775080 RepID=UPI00223BA034|nr:LysR family transcriptional regulator [Aestuariispira ectoiniformans]
MDLNLLHVFLVLLEEHSATKAADRLGVTQAAVSAALTLGEFLARDHILISCEGLTGVIDDILAEQGLQRRIGSATSHYAALPFLLRGSEAIATLPAHAARALAQASSLDTCHCPLALPEFGVDLSWRFDALRDPAFMLFRDLVVDQATTFFHASSQ